MHWKTLQPDVIPSLFSISRPPPLSDGKLLVPECDLADRTWSTRDRMLLVKVYKFFVWDLHIWRPQYYCTVLHAVHKTLAVCPQIRGTYYMSPLPMRMWTSNMEAPCSSSDASGILYIFCDNWSCGWNSCLCLLNRNCWSVVVSATGANESCLSVYAPKSGSTWIWLDPFDLEMFDLLTINCACSFCS